MDHKKFLMEKSWLKVLKGEFEKPYLKNLQKFLAKELEGGYTIYPKPELIFNAFCQTPFEDVKVVIIGQDPYHGEEQAHGLSFSVKKNIPTPPSLQNIFKELGNDVGIKTPSSGYLLPWAKQGVLLLNATLTVREKNPRSHYGKGWEVFTDVVVEKLMEKKDPIAFLLWGKSAQEKCLNVISKFSEIPHLILKASHPSFYSASGFFGCKHFSKTNAFLEKIGKKKIDWQIE